MHFWLLWTLVLASAAHGLIRPQLDQYQRELLLDHASRPESYTPALPGSSYFQWPYTPEWIRSYEQWLRETGAKWAHWGLNDTCTTPIPDFPCRPFDDHDGVSFENRTAKQVRHRDIRIHGVLGDSISAGFAMISSHMPKTRVFEYRGKVFSIGADKGETTIPNLFSAISSKKAYGAPRHVTLPLASGKDLDRAISGSIAQNLPAQANSLTKLLSLPPYLVHRHQWKLVTVLIGANNLCRVCTLPNVVGIDDMIQSIRTALLTLRNAEQRWVINLMGLFKVSQVFDAAMPVPYCKTIFERFHFCPCIRSPTSRKLMDELVAQLNVALKSLALEFSNDPHFRVNYQPAFTGTDIAQYGQEYLSKLDCFHPNLCANQVMSLALWNGMLEDQTLKTTSLDPHQLTWKCPSRDNMYIR